MDQKEVFTLLRESLAATLLGAAVSLVLMVICLHHVFVRRAGQEPWLWAVALILATWIAAPIYFWVHIWPDEGDETGLRRA